MIIREGIINDVIRVQTDSVMLTKPHEFNKTHLNIIPEAKTTGRFTWYNCNFNNTTKRKIYINE